MERGRRKEMVGVVVSTKMDKTAVVSVERRVRHPLYRKIIRRTTKYKAHDPRNEATLGDVVRLQETRPISKEKRWRIAEIMTKGDVAEIQPGEIAVPEEVRLKVEPPPQAEPETAAEAETETTAQAETETTAQADAKAETEAEEEKQAEEATEE